MRTLKKTLSLVLVVAMVLGLCVVGASAYNKVEDFTDDVDKIGDAYYEAVGVLTGIQVIDGMTETSFQPQGNYTREQAAKIIAYMMLGKADADSLRCTKAPFDDVAADRWSAGYIAFCVEQGIIDGMTETTFEPTGTLTGFQWAKMLLCAVGFGVKGEFTGSSWSLNTSKYAHNVDLFAGDLAGADHTAITREQAALYAFNVLTAVDLVVYSESLGDYIKGYNSWFVDRYTPQGTLAETVFKLYNATGIIVDNEALGAPVTVVNTKGGYDYTAANLVKVAADTGLDMMYHAARVWYVAGKTNTGVFSYDLAKVETTNCPANLPTKDVKNIGKEVAGSVPYQYDKVDNSAVDAGTVNVVMYYALGTMGTRSEVNKTTIIAGEKVENAYIKTDISKIDKNATIIYLRGQSTTTDKAGWHVFAPTATSGSVKSLSGKGVITLTDGTVLAPSRLVGHGRTEALARIEEVLSSTIHSTPTYYFVLDTHGHYITMTEDPYRTVALYTGSWRITSSHDAWSTSVQFEAQFVDVKTGEIKVVPVRNTWVENNSTLMSRGYFDITDELFGDATYAPHALDYTDTYYGGSYAIGVDAYTFRTSDTANKIPVTVGNRDTDYVRFNSKTVTFIIVNGAGDSLTIDKYTGVEELIAGYAKKSGMPITSVTLDNMALVVSDTAAGNKSASVIFAYDSALATGGVAFFPKDVDRWDIVADSYYGYNLTYLNGEKETSEIRVSKDATVDGVRVNANGADISRGFYFYTLNEQNFCIDFHRVPIQSSAVFYTDNDIDMTHDGKYWINDDVVADNCKVVDTRTNAGVTVDTIDELAELVENNYYSEPIQVFYLKTGSEVDLIYVVDFNLGWTYIDSMDGWTVNGSDKVETYEDDTVILRSAALAGLDNGTVIDFVVTVNSVPGREVSGTVATDANGKYVALDVHYIVGQAGYKKADVVFTAATYDVILKNNQAEFDAMYQIGEGALTAFEDTGKTITVPVGTQIQIALKRDTVATGLTATVTVLNGTKNFEKVKAYDATYGYFTDLFVPATNSVTIDSVIAAFTFTMGERDSNPAMALNFTSAADVSSNSDNDTLAWTAVPGSVKTVYVEYSDHNAAGATVSDSVDKTNLRLTTANNANNITGSKFIFSSNTIAQSGTNNVFVFGFVPVANTDSVTAYTWSNELFA